MECGGLVSILTLTLHHNLNLPPTRSVAFYFTELIKVKMKIKIKTEPWRFAYFRVTGLVILD